MLEELTIDDPGVPLSMMPQTGISEMINTLASGLVISALLVSIVATTIRKMGKKEEEEAV